MIHVARLVGYPQLMSHNFQSEFKNILQIIKALFYYNWAKRNYKLR